jgi:hypothetical protein
MTPSLLGRYRHFGGLLKIRGAVSQNHDAFFEVDRRYIAARCALDRPKGRSRCW